MADEKQKLKLPEWLAEHREGSPINSATCGERFPVAARPTGDFVFNAPSSMLLAPVVTVPLISVGGLPVGVQLMGQQHDDARITGLARWFSESLKRVATPA